MLKARIMRILLVVMLLGMIGTSFGSGWFILRELSGSGHIALAIPQHRLPPNPGSETVPPEPPNNPPTTEAGCAIHTDTITQIAQICEPKLATVALPNSPGTGLGSDLGVYLHSGELWLHAVDLEIPGRGFNWKFERTYRSGILLNGTLGFNWEFNYDRRLMEVSQVNLEAARAIFRQVKIGDVIRADSYGRSDLYVRNPDGSYTAPTGFYTRLIKNPDGTFVERDREGNKAFYLKPDPHQGLANLAELRDRNGNSMRFQYNAQGQLVRVLDTLGRPIEYRYDDKGRIVEVRDFFGRSIKLEYNRRGQLIAVTSPAVTGTPNGNDFPNGKTVRYKYSSGFADERLEHNLLEITAPNEVASGGKPRVVVTYDTDPASPTADRVLSLRIGGTNATAIPAGGTVRYEYKKLADPRPGDFNSAVSQTTVTDRNGNVTEYQFNQLGNIVRIREFTNRDIRPGDPEFFETRFEFNKEGEVLKVIYPEGNSMEYDFDDENPDRFQQGNLLAEIRRPDPKRGGDQAFIKTTYAYEPIYNQLARVTEARGNDPSYVPQNGGANSPGRYTTVYIFDYQESTNFAALARELGVSESEVRALLARAGIKMGLGDINGDGRTDQIAGNVIRVEYPTVQLLPACPSDELTAANPNCSLQARLEGTSRQPIVELYQYNKFGQMTKRIDPEGNVDVYEYHPENDPDGDGRDLTPGVGSGPFGYLKAEIQDAESNPVRNSKTNPAPAKIKRQYFYDRVGNVIKEIDGRGIATEYAVNQLNQVVEIRRAADVSEALKNPEEPNWRACTDQTLIECKAGMVAFKYRTRIFYDHNNNVVKREIENRDSNNKELAGDWITHEFKYDILDNLIEETQEVSENPREIIVTKYRYDRNENRVLEISPVANLPAGHPERQPSNVVSYVFDERDLLFTSTRGGLTDQFKALAAHADIPELRTIPNSPYISTFARNYDLNRNLKESIDAADNTGDGKPEVTTYLYDGFDRQVSVIDAIGNQSFTQYDPASNVIRVSNFGPVGGKSPTSNAAANFKQPLRLEDFRQPLLSQVEFKYDEMKRQFERNDKLFVYQGVEYKRAPALQDGPLGTSNDGVVVTRFEYDRLGRRTFAIEDDLSTLQYRYDGADRLIHEIDPTYSETIRVYDDNGNLIALTRIESSVGTDLPNLKEEFTSIVFYDSLNRPIRITYPLGYTERSHFDSRDNLILKSDPQASNDEMGLIIDPLPLGNINRKVPKQADKINKPGNTVEYLYDGLNRKISEIYHLRADGQGSNSLDKGNPSNPDGLIVLDMKWDANSRLVARADDGSSPGDQNTSIGVIESAKAKGNVTRYYYDDLNRYIRQTFDDGSCETFEYDADNNIVRMIDANGTIVLNKFDGKNRLIERDITRGKSSDTHPLGCFKDASVAWSIVGTTRQEFQFDGLSRLTYAFDNNEPDDPSDDSRVEILYDSLNRIVEEKQNGQAISSQWMGDSNRTKLIYPTGYQLTYQYDRGDRMISISNPKYDQPIVKYAYIGPSRVLERIFSNGTRLTFIDKVRQSQVGYDAQNRIVKLQHLAGERLLAEFSYSYDRMGNKLSEKTSHGSKDTTSEFKYDSIYQLVNSVSNEWGNQQWVLDGVGNWHSRNNKSNTLNNLNQYVEFGTDKLKYDADGSLTEDGTYFYEYDFARRLRAIFNKADRTLVASMSYDALGRRTRISTRNNFTNFYYDLFREIQEVKPNGSVQQYIFGNRVDEILALEKDLNGDGIPEDRYFYGEDGRRNVVFITDIKGAIVETMPYDPFGNLEIRNAQGVRLRVSDVGNPYFFTGRRLDNETGLYYFRFRYYSAKYGRFLTRDPIDVEGSLIYNLYDYVRNNPLNYLDPMGLQPCRERELFCATLTKEFDPREQRPRERDPNRRLNLGHGFNFSISITQCKKCCMDCSIKNRVTYDITGNYEFSATGRFRIYYVIYAELYGSASASGRIECTTDECKRGESDCCLTLEASGRVGARIVADIWVARAGVGGELFVRCTLQFCVAGVQTPLTYGEVQATCCVSGRIYAFAEYWWWGWNRVEVDIVSGNLIGSC